MPWEDANGRSLFHEAVPWEQIARFLNSLTAKEFNPEVEKEAFIYPPQGFARILPEDWEVRGQDYTKDYFPGDWFENGPIDVDERMKEYKSTLRVRIDRVLWNGIRLASVGFGLLASVNKLDGY